MRREAGGELGIQEFDRAITPDILAVAAHTRRHGALVRRRVLNAVRDLDLRRINRCERDERRSVEGVAVAEEVVGTFRDARWCVVRRVRKFCLRGYVTNSIVGIREGPRPLGLTRNNAPFSYFSIFWPPLGRERAFCHES